MILRDLVRPQPLSLASRRGGTADMMIAVLLSAHSLTLALVSPAPPSLQHTRREFAAAAAAAAMASCSASTAATNVPTSVKLANGANFPLASFGLQIYDDDTAERLTLLAIESGYRNFFASVLANNQVGFARAIKRSPVAREDIYICGSVVSNRAIDEETAYTLTKLGCMENMKAFAVGGISQCARALRRIALALSSHYSLSRLSASSNPPSPADREDAQSSLSPLQWMQSCLTTLARPMIAYVGSGEPLQRCRRKGRSSRWRSAISLRSSST
jgi:hypothetical protein